MRLQKYLAEAGVASRRKCEEIIAQGRVRVNGRAVTQMGTQVTGDEKIELDGKPVRALKSKLYLLLYKPRGVVSTVSDDKNRQTVMDYFKGMSRVYPVGRLDYDTEGILVMTNDGEFANRLMHPRYNVKKRYYAKTRGVLTDALAEKLLTGVQLSDGMAQADGVEIVKIENGRSYFNITVHEGRNRLIRRMCEALGQDVLRLRRIGYGPLTLNGLRPGEYRHLTPKEIRDLTK